MFFCLMGSLSNFFCRPLMTNRAPWHLSATDGSPKVSMAVTWTVATGQRWRCSLANLARLKRFSSRFCFQRNPRCLITSGQLMLIFRWRTGTIVACQAAVENYHTMAVDLRLSHGVIVNDCLCSKLRNGPEVETYRKTRKILAWRPHEQSISKQPGPFGPALRQLDAFDTTGAEGLRFFVKSIGGCQLNAATG